MKTSLESLFFAQNSLMQLKLLIKICLRRIILNSFTGICTDILGGICCSILKTCWCLFLRYSWSFFCLLVLLVFFAFDFPPAKLRTFCYFWGRLLHLHWHWQVSSIVKLHQICNQRDFSNVPVLSEFSHSIPLSLNNFWNDLYGVTYKNLSLGHLMIFVWIVF